MTFGGLAILFFILEGIRAYNEGVYADTHGTTGNFDLFDYLLIAAALICLVSFALLASTLHRKQ